MKRVHRDSTAITELWVDPIKGLADVMYSNGHMYTYSNVNKSALLNVMINKSISLGKWVNKNCKAEGVTCQWFCHESPWMTLDEPELPEFV
jgi:hypothetical protein